MPDCSHAKGKRSLTPYTPYSTWIFLSSVREVVPVAFRQCSQVRINIINAPVRVRPLKMLQEPQILQKVGGIPPSRENQRGCRLPSFAHPVPARKHLPETVPENRLRAHATVGLHVFQEFSIFLVHLNLSQPRLHPLAHPSPPLHNESSISSVTLAIATCAMLSS
ncbi:hypothetical protein SBA4_1420005 [Candidatus Sulfopaludibacter sp. SbA4]|nr:hypothetical protein SBA4_1420005 [Candidatus Sulfopaludibacter sp. SbA4]